MRRLMGDQVEKVWIMTHTKKDETPIDPASSEAMGCFYYVSSTIISRFEILICN